MGLASNKAAAVGVCGCCGSGFIRRGLHEGALRPRRENSRSHAKAGFKVGALVVVAFQDGAGGGGNFPLNVDLSSKKKRP
jgi:hypothetical protein